MVAYDAATVSSSPFSVMVTQLAGQIDTKVINSETGLAPDAWINGGGSFSVSLTAQDGTTTRVLTFAETFSGTFTAGHTLQNVADAINLETVLQLNAEVIVDPNTNKETLSVKGIAGNETPLPSR